MLNFEKEIIVRQNDKTHIFWANFDSWNRNFCVSSLNLQKFLMIIRIFLLKFTKNQILGIIRKI
jgi:hypothetical protein